MGNRAVITIRDNLKNRDDWQSIYLHWNGGYDTVKPALELAKEYGVRCEQEYGIARLAQIFGNFFGGTLSLGVGRYSELDTDNGDNGVYIVGNDWEIVERQFKQEEEQNYHDYDNMIKAFKKSNDKVFLKDA